MKFLGGLGKVVYKNKPVMEDTLAPSELTAVRHANGKDWWIITPQYQKPAYYVFLFTKDGIVDTLEQTIGVPYDIGGWQCIFSPDGAKFVRYGIYDDISIFDFDRATGQLSNFKFIPLEEETYQGFLPVFPGCAISPNSRFLYIAAQYSIYQFDLWADDIEASKQLIAIYDNFYSPYPTTFNTMQLGPDCKDLHQHSQRRRCAARHQPPRRTRPRLRPGAARRIAARLQCRHAAFPQLPPRRHTFLPLRQHAQRAGEHARAGQRRHGHAQPRFRPAPRAPARAGAAACNLRACRHRRHCHASRRHPGRRGRSGNVRRRPAAGALCVDAGERRRGRGAGEGDGGAVKT
ncbi:MAG: hypothetical protein IPK76_09565 [Lewinellaceae bacterium]|nr:hypothetical protein [Lewinellaceae bacterium]